MKNTSQAGLSLVELMVGLTISLMIIFGIGYVYLDQQNSTRAQRELSKIQSDAQLALYQLGVDIRQAGFTGCNSNLTRGSKESNEISISNPDPNLPFALNSGTVIRVFNPSQSPNENPQNIDPNHPIIELWYADANGAAMLWSEIINTQSSPPTTIKTVHEVQLTLDEERATASGERVALLSDCEGGALAALKNEGQQSNHFRLTSTTTLTGTTCGHASNIGASCVYWRNATVWPIRMIQYYVTSEKDPQGKTARKLYTRSRIMTSKSPAQWNPPQLVLDKVRFLKISAIGIDGESPEPFTWGVTKLIKDTAQIQRYLDDPTSKTEDWRRVVRLDFRLSMETEGAVPMATAGSAAKRPSVYRDYFASYTLRSRTSPEPLR